MNRLRIGFVLLSNSKAPIPSTRIAVLNLFPFLEKANFEPHIAYEPAFATETPNLSDHIKTIVDSKYDVVVFQKVHGESVERLVRELAASGTKTIYCVCDLVNERMVQATDATIVVSEFLRAQYPEKYHSKIFVVHDGIEKPNLRKINFREDTGSKSNPLQAVLITSADLDHLPQIGTPPEWLEVTILGRYPPANDLLRHAREKRWKLASKTGSREKSAYLKFLLNKRIKCVAWNEELAYETMQKADIGIIPITCDPTHVNGQPAPSWKVKSENRLTLKMSMALPVIATSIPAYESVIDHGVNGYFARSSDDWSLLLSLLRDPGKRRRVGEAARESVTNSYSMSGQATRFVDVVNSALTANKSLAAL